MPRRLQTNHPFCSISTWAATERVETRSTEQNADKNQGLKKPDKIAGHIGRGEDQRNTSAEQSLSTGEMAEVKKQFLLTETTLGYLDGTLEVFKSATGAKISQSLFLRSIIKAIHRMKPQLEIEAREIGKVKLPQKIRGKEHLREQLENQIAEAILSSARRNSD